MAYLITMCKQKLVVVPEYSTVKISTIDNLKPSKTRHTVIVPLTDLHIFSVCVFSRPHFWLPLTKMYVNIL